MRFVIDAQLPPAMARLLADRGFSAEHVADLGMQDSDDSSIWTYALKYDAVLITKDEDFPRRIHQRQSANVPIVVWLRISNTSRRALLNWFQPLIPKIINLVQEGERLIEIR